MANEFIARNGIVSKSNLIVSGSLTALSTITAQTLVVQTITSSISSITGSTNFGSLSSNTHTFTGSINASGSGNFSGSLTATSTFTLDGTKKIFLRSNQGSGGGLISGSAIGTMGNFSIYSDDGVAGDVLGMYYWNGSTYKSALQFANVSSGNSNLILMKDGGNVGIGVTPATFDTIGPVLQMGRAVFYGYNNEAAIGANFRYEGGDKYINSDFACLYQMKTGIHVFLTAPSGTAGAAMTLTERMRITSTNGGQLAVGGVNNTFVDYSGNVARFYGGSGTNTFGLGAASTIYYQGDNSQFYPTADNARSIGLGSNRYTAIYAVNGTIQTSDEREKTDIIDSDLGLDFVSKLRPVSFKWKIGQNNVTNETIIDEEGNETTKEIVTPRAGIRNHYGLIAQQVKEVLGDKDFGGFVHDTETDTMSLRYDQFISPLIKAIQELTARVQYLENK